MPVQNYTINGRVINRTTGQGIARLRVEAWDKDVKYNDLLGIADTDAAGRFTMAFDTTYFREYAPDVSPDLFFKVFQEKTLLKSTEKEVVKNIGTTYQTDIPVDMPVYTQRPPGKDRVATEQIFKLADFVQQSDFKGVVNEFRSKAGTSFGFVTDMVVNTISKLDIQPLKVSGGRTSDVVGQHVEKARQNLAANQVEVQEVKQYNPTLNTASLADAKAFPFALKPGQKVNLFTENGTVKYYALAEEQPPVAHAAAPAAMDNDKIKKLEEALAAAKQHAAQKDEQLLKLQQEMEQLRQGHSEIKNLVQSEAFTRLMQNMQKTGTIKERKGKMKDANKEGDTENKPG